MNLLVAPLLVFLLLAPQDKPTPKVTVGKDTTYVDGPLDREGYIDYQAALNDRYGKGITPEKNACVLIWKALGPTLDGGTRMPAEYFQRLGIAEPPVEGDYFIGWEVYLKNRLQLGQEELDAMQLRINEAIRQTWTAKEHPHLAAWLAANEKPLAIVIEATHRSQYFSPIIARRKGDEPTSLLGVLLPTGQKCRELTVAFHLRAQLRIAAGEFDAAWQDLMTCHRLARLLGQGASLVELLVGIAIESMTCRVDLSYLERAPLTSQQLRDRLKELQTLKPFPPLADRIEVGERFMYLETVQLVRRGGSSMLDMLTNGRVPEVNPLEVAALAQLDWDSALRSGNRWYDRMAAAMRLTDRAARLKELDQIKADLKALKEAAAAKAKQRRFGPEEQLDKTLAQGLSDLILTLLAPVLHNVQNAHDKTCKTLTTNWSNRNAICTSPSPWRPITAIMAATPPSWTTSRRVT